MKYQNIRTGPIIKFLIILLVLTIPTIYYLGWKSIGTNNFMYLRQLLSPSIKSTIKQTVYLIPTILSEGNSYLKRINTLEQKNRFMREILQTEFKTHFGIWDRYYNIDRRKVTCPKSAKVVLVTGQSNSANHSMSKKYENKQHVNYFNGSCYVLDNPVFGATGDESSITPAIASKLTSNSPYIFLTTGWTGTSITHWSGDNIGLSEYTNKHLKDLEDQNHNLYAVIWIQGEADSKMIAGMEPSVGQKNYIYYFNIMKSKILQGLSNKENVKFVITQTSICGQKQTRNKELNAQQLKLGKDKNTYVTEVTDNLGPKYRRGDNCHYNELGIEVIAEEISSVLNDIMND